MNTTRSSRPTYDRYHFDCGPCAPSEGFAQIDTSQDAPYYGTWCSPSARTIVNFCEGDLTSTVCDTDEEFVLQLRELAEWNDQAGYGPMKIDPANNDDLRSRFEALGLADLLH